MALLKTQVHICVLCCMPSEMLDVVTVLVWLTSRAGVSNLKVTL